MCVDDNICDSKRMDKIEQMLKQWLPVNTIIREQFRKIIVKAIQEAYNKGYRDGGSAGQ
tara:strand:- start:1258 stop:1434 length:177 start_codon:yes stop_codon:yes gene_type:complete